MFEIIRGFLIGRSAENEDLRHQARSSSLFHLKERQL